MKQKIYFFILGSCLGVISGYNLQPYLDKGLENVISKINKVKAHNRADRLMLRLFPDMAPIDIYKDENIIDILRKPGSVTLYDGCGNGGRIDIDGYTFFGEGFIISNEDAQILSVCFRSMNAFEVGLGSTCAFRPKILLRFRPEQGSDVVDFLLCKDCYLIKWYYNGKYVDKSTECLKMNATGASILESILEKRSR